MKGGGGLEGARVPHTYSEKWFFWKPFRIIPWLWKRVLHLVWALYYVYIVIGFLDQKLKFGAQKKAVTFNPNHVLATTGKSCSKKKSAFAQIIKGGNVILGDFWGKTHF